MLALASCLDHLPRRPATDLLTIEFRDWRASTHCLPTRVGTALCGTGAENALDAYRFLLSYRPTVGLSNRKKTFNELLIAERLLGRETV